MTNQISEHQSTRTFGKIISWAAFLTFDLIILGALVRATDSGLACPDWPLCYGQLAPAMDMQIFLEWFHRLSALILGGVLFAAVYQLFKNPLLRKKFSTQLFSAVALFLVQCALGGLTVLHYLDPTIVSFHLINAIGFFSVLLWTALSARQLTHASKQSSQLKIPRQTKTVLAVFTLIVFIQIIFGGAVSTNHAGLVCPDFPKCHGQWLPSGSFLINLQMFHRFIAFFLLAFALFINFMHIGVNFSAKLKLVIRSLPTLVLFQIFLGMINIYYYLPTWATVAHLANALVLFTLSLATTIILKLNEQKFDHHSPSSESALDQSGKTHQQFVTDTNQ
jgi:cytochrome c oxidase assembly protein subunit 15